MRSFVARGALLLSSLLTAVSAAAASSEVKSKHVLPSDFTPPPVFKNTNLLRTIDLTKPYSRETIAVIVENTSKEKQNEYFVPFPANEAGQVSYFDARDKKGPLGEFEVREVMLGIDSLRYTYSPPMALDRT
jgi:oligosaccharyltransferase complex subunit alpha (ribophorin I)